MCIVNENLLYVDCKETMSKNKIREKILGDTNIGPLQILIRMVQNRHTRDALGVDKQRKLPF